jgi:hypothetical protein
MTNDDIYNLVKFVLRKDDKGYPEIIKNFSKLLQQSSLDHFKEKYLEYQRTQEENDSMSPFEVRQAVSGLTTSTNRITLPTDYAHFIGMYWVDSDSNTRAFDLVTDDQWDMRLGSTVTIPSNNYPICKLSNDYVYINPTMVAGTADLYLYYGVGAVGLSDAQVGALSSQVMTTGSKTFSYSPSTQVCYFAYLDTYGTLSSITDDNGYEVLSDWTRRSGTIDTFTYYIYEFDNLTTQTDFEYTFNF